MEIPKIVKEIKDKGYVLIEGVLTSEECDLYKSFLVEDMNKYMGLHANVQNDQEKGLHNRTNENVVFNLHNKRLEYFNLLGHPIILDVMNIILKEGSYLNNQPYYLYNNQARNPLQGSEQQLHIDSRFPGTKYVLTANVIWMLDDFTEQSGATRIVPESHKSGEFAEDGKKYPNEKLVTASKGSLLIFDASLWHGSSYKHNSDDRWCVTLGFTRSFRKPVFDYMQNTPSEIYDNLTDGQKELLGFKLIPPKDEFTRMREIAETFQTPNKYELPKNENER
jgi:ectoine hydroxylase-related dioxygenase (phytanoyl-CoA dioxygenase family)